MNPSKCGIAGQEALLDCLVVDLPPGTGDELLAALALFGRKARLILVTTPSEGAVGIVGRLRRLADIERTQVAGVVVNMAYLSGGSAKGRLVRPFGELDETQVRRRLGATVLADIPLEPRISTEGLLSVMKGRGAVREAFDRLAHSIER